jgi:hypothetical protein
MKIRVSLLKDRKELAAKTTDVSKPGDLAALVESAFEEARTKHPDLLWECEILVRQA